MEKRFKSLSIFEFQKMFPDADICYMYLFDLRWEAGLICTQCGHKSWVNLCVQQ
jgi:hypothetical protein